MHVDEVSGSIVETAIELHRELGPGLIESVYETVLAHQLAARGLRVRSQQPVQLEYEGIVFRKAFRVDLLIEDTVVVEIKSTPKHDPVFERQVLTYLRLMRLPVGLVLNFGHPTLIAGVKRVVNDAPSHPGSRVRVNTSPTPRTLPTQSSQSPSSAPPAAPA